MTEIKQRNTSPGAKAAGIATFFMALAAVLILLGLPRFNDFLMSVKDYEISKGLSGSAWAGLDNYQALFAEEGFLPAILNTLRFSAISCLSLFLLALPAGYAVAAAGKVKWLGYALATALLLPLAVPGTVWAIAYARLARSPQGAEYLLPVWCSLRYIGLPCLLVAAAGGDRRGWRAPLLCGGVIALAMFTALGRFDYDVLRLYATPDHLTLDTYIFRSSFMNGKFTAGATGCVLRGVFSGILFAAAAYPILMTLKKLFLTDSAGGTTLKDRLLALPLPAGIALMAFLAMGATALLGFRPEDMKLYANLPVHALFAVLGALCNALLCFLLARPAACGTKQIRIITGMALLLATAANLSPVSVGEYLFNSRTLRLMDSYVVLLFHNLGSVWGVWPLLLAAKAMGVQGSADWFRRMWRPALALVALQAVIAMNSSIVPLLYINNPAYQPPLALATMQMGRGLPVNFALLALVTAVIPALLLLAARTALNEKESAGFLMPGK